MYDVERDEKILAILREKKTIGVNELANLIFCSPSTIRRDLNRLEKKGLLYRSFGSASIVPDLSKDSLDTSDKKQENILAWRSLCHKAATLFKGNSTLFIDDSPILNEISAFLLDFANLIVITNNLSLASLVAKTTAHRIILMGGELNSIREGGGISSNGSLTNAQAARFHADFALLSCAGFDLGGGASEDDIESAQLKATMARNATTKIVVCGSGCIGCNKPFRSISLTEINYLVTDAKLLEKEKKSLSIAGISVFE